MVYSMLWMSMARFYSWVLGKLDKLQFFLLFGRHNLKFFESGYGDVDMTERFAAFWKGAPSNALSSSAQCVRTLVSLQTRACLGVSSCMCSAGCKQLPDTV